MSMSNLSFLALIRNASLLLALAVVFDTTSSRWQSGDKFWKQLLRGLALGGIGIIVMNTPWVYGQGLVFDTRSILLSVSGLFFGVIPTVIAMVMTAVYRFTQGGAYLTGISVIVATSLLGILLRFKLKNKLVEMNWWQLYLFGIVVHVVMLLLMFTQPMEVALPLVSKIGFPIMSIYPAVTVLLGLLLLNRMRRERDVQQIHKSQKRLGSMVDILQISDKDSQSLVDFAMEEAVRLTESELGFIFYYSEDQKKFMVSSWSKSAMEACKIPQPQTVYELEKTGIWGEPVRQRKPIVINDFQAQNPLKKGYPVGHPHLIRLLEIPVIIENQIVAVVGMGNKKTDYDDIDIAQLNLLMEMVWKTTERRKAIEDLRVSEENYRYLFDQSADGIFITTQDGDYLDVNKSGSKMLGYTPEELRTHYKEILANDDKSIHIEKMSDLLQKQQIVLTERQIKTKNGNSIDVEILTQLLPDGRIQKIVRDISERKKAEEIVQKTQKELQALLKVSDDSRKALLSVIEDQKLIEEALRKSEESYRNLFENITQGFALHKIILNETGVPVDYHFLAVNPAYEKLTGLKKEIIIGESAKTILPNLEQSWIDTYGEVALSGKPKHFEDYTAAIGKYYEVFAFCPEPGYFAVIISDISERKKYEMEIRNFNLELENRVKLRTAELESANRELESFSYSISHDLRAPLRSINGFSQILLEEHAKDFNLEVSHYFELIRKNSAMMGNLVDDLLNFSRLGRLPLNKTKVDPSTVINEVLDSVQMEIEQRNIKVKIDKMPVCEADASLLRQVYINLISNSVKFTRTQNNPQIEIGFVQNYQNQTGRDVPSGLPCYYVRDNGVGFDMKFYDKLFGVFQRLHRAEEYEGTGVGLAIVDRIIKKHGGQIWAESAVGKGTTFYFSLGEPNNG